MLINNPFGNRQSESRSHSLATRFVGPIEAVENMRNFIRIHPDTGILELTPTWLSFLQGTHLDETIRRIFKAILDENKQKLLQIIGYPIL